MADRESLPFVDYLNLTVEAGRGGHGCVAFRREKFVPRGGPCGGDGGRGGHVILKAMAKLSTLTDLKHRGIIKAQRGGEGGGNNCTGGDGEDVVIPVPQGTVVSDETGAQLADLTEDGQEWIAARGGRGGKGNAHFASATMKTPRFAQDGEEGESKRLTLELKLIADVGLVGLPNAGKSTLLAALTAARPKIAAYPFTTLSPNLGVMAGDDYHNITLADIPGLIEGACKGVGLGDRFLRHVERTRILLHLIGDEKGLFEPEEMRYKYELVRRELEAYSSVLVKREEILILSKIDLAPEGQVEKVIRAFQEKGLDLLPLSSQSGEGLEALRELLRQSVLEQKHSEGQETHA